MSVPQGLQGLPNLPEAQFFTEAGLFELAGAVVHICSLICGSKCQQPRHTSAQLKTAALLKAFRFVVDKHQHRGVCRRLNERFSRCHKLSHAWFSAGLGFTLRQHMRTQSLSQSNLRMPTKSQHSIQDASFNARICNTPLPFRPPSFRAFCSQIC